MRKMPGGMFTRFTIGQFAALHGINKKTLMWYDEVGLLHPVEVGENGYRYYNYYQSSTLETILQLRDLGVSIPDVQAFLRSRSPAMLGGLIEEKLTDLDEQIRQLERTRADLLAKRAALHRLQHLDLDKIELTQLPEARLIAIPVNKHTPPETAIELMLKQASRQRLPRLYSGVYGSMIPVPHLRQGRFYDYTAIFMEAPDADAPNVHICPAGAYLRGWCKGSWDLIPDQYRRMLAYADAHELELSGHSYERGINERVIDNIDDYITQIDIQVKPKP